LKAVQGRKSEFLKRGQELGFTFISGQRPQPNARGRVPTTMEWAKRLTARDIYVLAGRAPYSERVPDVDEGFTQADVQDPRRGPIVAQVIQWRLAVCKQHRPNGFLVREAPARDVRQLALLLGHLQPDLFITKFRKVFTRDEMNDDLVLARARLGDAEDTSEYEEMLPTSPP